MPVCAACGQENPDEARFCLACGQTLVAEAPGQRKSRKTVTVLFCDVAGYTATGEQLDPEALRRIQSRYFDEARAALERHGGTVEKFAGDAVMAVFGIPQIHEDDALRAVRAAADLRAAVEPLGLRVRIGVNTGEVVAGEGDALVTGDAVNVAARLEQAAEPGTILLGEGTNALVSAAVTAEAAGPFEAKGKAEPLPAWRLIGVREGVEATPRRLDAPLIGRQRELAQLHQAWERARHERRCHLFTILGPPGVGKSRLASELAHELRDESTVVAGRCLSYGEAITYWPLAEILEQLQGRIRELLEGEEKADVIETRLAAVSGDPESVGTSEEISWAARKLLERLAHERPLVVVLDDLHWSEPTLLDLVEHVADWSREAPILLLCLARPDLLEARPTWGGGKLNATSILLEPLSEHESANLVETLAGDTLPEESRSRILAAAEGNPLFVEQMVALAGENGAESELQVPPTIQALLAARLDRLHPSERATLEYASVIGQEFERTALAELAPEEADLGPALGALVRKELIRPVDDETFAFRHLLIRDAAYDALAKELRAELHERFATWLESAEGEYDEMVAYHLERAFDYRRQLGPVDEAGTALGLRAAEKLEAVGRRALARGDVHAAEHALGRAIELLPADHPSRPPLIQELAHARLEQGKLGESDAAFAEAEVAARVAGNRAIEVRSRLERARIRLASDLDVDAMQAEAERALEAFRELGDSSGAARAFTLLAMLADVRGDGGAGRAAAGQALEHARDAGDERLEDHARGNRWNALWWTGGSPAKAIELAEEDRLWAKENGNLAAEAAALQRLGRAHAAAGDFDEGRAFLDESRRLAEELGRGPRIASIDWIAGEVEMLAGNAAAAEERYRAAYVFYDSNQEHGYLSSVAADLAHALAAQGKAEEATRLSEISEQYTGARDLAAQIGWRTARARALAHLGESAQADALARDALDLDTGNDPVGRAWILIHLAEIQRAGGQIRKSSEAASEALSIFEARGRIAQAQAAKVLLDELQAELLAERE